MNSVPDIQQTLGTGDSIQEFGFKIPVLARSSGEVVDGHLRLNAARKFGLTEVPVILCDEWSETQVKAFRLMVNRSAGWAEWDENLLGLELLELKDLDFDLTLTAFDSREIDDFLSGPDLDEGADAVPPVPDHPASRLEWRDRAGLNGYGPAEASYMKRRTEGHTNTTISSETSIGRKPSLSCRVSKSLTCGTLRNSHGKFWTGCCVSASYII